MIDIDKLIEQANDLTPLPASTVRLAELVGHTDCDLGSVAELIAFDQVLTLKLLRAANSAANAGSTLVKTAQEAVLRLGMGRVVSLAVAAGAKPLMKTRIPAYGLDEGALWRHSVAAAVAVDSIPQCYGISVPPEAFTAALLHDIGKLVMGRFLDPNIIRFIKQAVEIDHLGELEAESAILGVHHGELGGLIAQHWQLPPLIVRGILYHHHPELGLDSICDITCLANHLAKQIEATITGQPCHSILPAGVAERLELTPDQLETLSPRVLDRYEQVKSNYDAV